MKSREIAQISEEIINLIFERDCGRATALIEQARQSLPKDELHRLIALSAMLQKRVGDVDSSLALMRQAHQEQPKWLPHLYRLSVYLMDAEEWPEADIALDELISLSENKGDAYFLDDARLMKMVCLKALGRRHEIQNLKSKVSPDAVIYIGDKTYSLDDFE